MLGTLDRPRASVRFAVAARPIELVGNALLRYGLVLFLVAFGLAKFTAAEAAAIQPWVANSPLLGWLYGITSVQGASNLIGIVEIATGVLLAVRPWWPRLSLLGSAAATLTFLVTISFLFTTPDLTPETAGFFMKDVMLLAAAIWTAGDALRAAERRAATTPR
jgi:uncharacterized membrane protein YkgB